LVRGAAQKLAFATARFSLCVQPPSNGNPRQSLGFTTHAK